MYKLIIIIETPDDPQQFDETWPVFLKQVEKMPGLIREATVRVTKKIFGNCNVSMIHELFFESLEALQNAMISPQGQTSGQVLQRITNGHMVLLMAEHREDDLTNIRKFQTEELDADNI
jgi:uncharacterized protein (TIGR02118 family)